MLYAWVLIEVQLHVTPHLRGLGFPRVSSGGIKLAFEEKNDTPRLCVERRES